jgi:hypothetical protein
LLLRHYGFDVTTSESKEHAREQIERSPFDLLISGDTLPQDACWGLAAVFRRHNLKGKIIEIVPSPWATPKNQPDFSVVGTAEPDQLIGTIHQNTSIRNSRISFHSGTTTARITGLRF